MGTDIHMAVEVRRAGKWTWLRDAVNCYDCDGTKVSKWSKEKQEPCFCVRWNHRGSTPGRKHGYCDRNYDAFGVLADVRNGTWGEPTPIIDDARGLPDDLSAELKAADEAPYELPDGHENPDHYSLGDHSYSYATLDELLKFNWDQRAGRSAYIPLAQYQKWDKTSPPDSYAGGVSGLILSPTEADKVLEGVKLGATAITGQVSVKVQWGETLAAMVGDFHTKFIPDLVFISEREGVPATDVRIVFGFDS